MKVDNKKIKNTMHKFSYSIVYVDKGKSESLSGEVFDTGAEQVILSLLDQYPRCTGKVKRVKS